MVQSIEVTLENEFFIYVIRGLDNICLSLTELKCGCITDSDVFLFVVSYITGIIKILGKFYLGKFCGTGLFWEIFCDSMVNSSNKCLHNVLYTLLFRKTLVMIYPGNKHPCLKIKGLMC